MGVALLLDRPPHRSRQNAAGLALRLLQLGQGLLQALGDLRQLPLQQQVEPSPSCHSSSVPDNTDCSATAAGSSHRA
jgi:hypothetical protein